MRRVSSVFVSSVLAVVLWTAGEGIALASAGSTIGPPAPLSSASCKPSEGRSVLSLSDARSCWPRAAVAADGFMPEPGEYIIPHGGGWIRAGLNLRLTLSSRDALAYSCGVDYTLTIQSWEQWLTYIAFTTGSTVRYCEWGYNNWKTPKCSGFGHCDPPVTGVIGNHTSTVNPWYNQQVEYLAGSEFFYCRHYIRADMSWSAYCD